MKKIGKVTALCLIVIGVIQAAVEDISVSLYDLDKQPIQRLYVGQSAHLKISVRGKLDAPHLKINGLKSFHVEPRGQFQQVMSVNGKAQHSYEFNFLIRAPREGSYPLGPLMIDQQLFDVSTVFEVKIGTHDTAATSKQFFLEYEPLKHGLVVGQKASLRITFGSLVPMALQSFQLPNLDKSLGEFSNMHQVNEGIQKINGTDYYCVTWVIDFIAHQPGEIVLPECSVACLIKSERANTLFGGLLLDVFGSKQQKMIYSKPLKFSVKELPPTDKVVLAVGKFSDFRIFVDKPRASLDEGLALTLQVNSVDYSDHIKRPELILPEGIKSYDSSERIFQTQFGYAKTFEYILQSTQEASYSIPSQEFTYYDPELEQYETLQTDQCTIDFYAQTPAKAPREHDEMVHQKAQQHIFSINEAGPWRAMPERALPPLIFRLLVTILLAYIGYLFTFSLYALHAEKLEKIAAYYFSFYIAQRQLDLVAQGKSSRYPYDILIQCLRNRLPDASHADADEAFEYAVDSRYFSAQESVAWQQFLYTLKHHKFGGVRATPLHDINEAQRWLQRLKKTF